MANIIQRIMGSVFGINTEVVKDKEAAPKKESSFNGASRSLFAWSYNGEKDLGAIGPVVDYYLDYCALRSRSWKAYLDSELAQIILGKFTLWNIGTGLKLQCQPVKRLLSANGINLDVQDFNEETEARFTLFCDSKLSDFSQQKTLNQLANKCFLHSKIGGDVLVILRYEKNQMTVQLIDGSHVESPLTPKDKVEGNKVMHGVEIDSKGRHVAYYVRIDTLSYERIPCYNSANGDLVSAFLVYGFEYRLNSLRGIPLISAVMQTIAQIDRYKEATLAAAEEAANVVYTIEHKAYSDGKNPLADEIRRANGLPEEDIPQDSDGQALADKVYASTKRQTFNLTQGAEMKSFASQKELYFKDFYTTNANIVCSTVGIPPDVAMSIFNGSYSASRAAIKDWEHTLNVGRKDFSSQFYVPVYAFWLEIEILKGNIKAPGYLQALQTGDYTLLQAYRNARFAGSSVPHIDPLKEVEASRLKLGVTGAAIPLSTVERETEALNTGDSDENMEQYAEELAESIKNGIKIPEVAPVKK